MRICVIGEFSGNLDEGMRNVAFYLSRELGKSHEVLCSDIREIYSRQFWKKAKDFNPQIIQYIPGPSIRSFMITKALGLYCRNAKTVVLAMHPAMPFRGAMFVPLLKPDLILAQSAEDEEMFANLGCKVKFWPMGIDADRFTPASKEVKNSLREKYNLDKSKFIFLHVGHIRQGRSLQTLERIQDEDNQVLIIGSTFTEAEEKAYRHLKERGCFVWIKYFEHIEEIYALADCYIFPVVNRRASIALPLSVMEAMACNLPVISTRFGGLTRIFNEGDGLAFVETEKDLVFRLKRIRNGSIEVKTREKVLPYSLENSAQRLEVIYGDLL